MESSYAKIIDALEKENKIINNGNGSMTIRYIISALTRNDWHGATSEWQHDGDKLYQYPSMRKLVEKHLGCRSHLIKDCKRWPCNHLKG
jgi:hypothetical protein